MIGFDTEGIPELRAKLKMLGSDKLIKEASEEVAKHLRTEMQRYPAVRRVTRKQAYGRSFESDRQRRWFFAALHSGELKLPYHRSGKYRKNWEIMPFGANNFIVVNDNPAAPYLQDELTQSHMAKLIGWRTWQEVLWRQSDKIRYIANSVYDRWRNRLGL